MQSFEVAESTEKASSSTKKPNHNKNENGESKEQQYCTNDRDGAIGSLEPFSLLGDIDSIGGLDVKDLLAITSIEKVGISAQRTHQLSDRRANGHQECEG